jgi:hypothetical protein
MTPSFRCEVARLCSCIIVAIEGGVEGSLFVGVLLLTVRVETVDAELDLGQNATGLVQLAVVESRLYHLRRSRSKQTGWWGDVWI